MFESTSTDDLLIEIWNPICHSQPTLRLLQDRSPIIWALHLAIQDRACTAKLSAIIVVNYIIIIFIICNYITLRNLNIMIITR